MNSYIAKILVIDDEPSFGRIVTAILSSMGYCLHTVSDAAQALRKLEDETFDLVLTDLNLPGLRGDELAQEMRNRGIDCPIVLMTGMELRRHPKHISAILPKPFSVPDLSNVVNSTLEENCALAAA